MGQLIKLQDYISRYEIDMYNYPARFIRLKRKQWELYKDAWEYEKTRRQQHQNNDSDFFYDSFGEEKRNIWKKIKDKLKRRHHENELPVDDVVISETLIDDSQNPLPGNFTFSDEYLPETLDELKRQFLEEIFQVQMTWASSTFSSQSFIDSSFYREENLKYFIQRFPDTYLFLYQPIFLLKKAPVESETIFFTPTEAFCISFLEKEEGAVYIGLEDYFWEGRLNQRQEKFLNPLISLNRTESIVKGIWKQENIDFPIKKIILSRNGYIDFPQAPYGVIVIDRRNYDDWFKRMRLSRSPLKSIQLKAAKSILEHCKTTAIPRYD